MSFSDPNAPERRSWVEVDAQSDFPIQNLPYGVGQRADESPRAFVAIGDYALDLTGLQRNGLLAVPGLPADVFNQPSLNAFLRLGRPVWAQTRARLSQLLDAEAGDEVETRPLVKATLVPQADLQLQLPVAIGDFVDLYSSIHHAKNLGRLFRPDGEPLLPNWRHLPVGYHGRAGSVVVSGTPVVRPRGHIIVDGQPSYLPSRILDIELEVGFVVGTGNAIGQPIPISEAREHVFGLVLVNDWSARDIQLFEYQPLGPFLGKSFATSASPWLVTLDALEPFLVPAPLQEPPPGLHLRSPEPAGIDLTLEVHYESAAMRHQGIAPLVISRVNFSTMYWTIPQQLAHATSNGAPSRTGDLFAMGTVSGPDPGTEGSLIELTWRGERPLKLPTGESRTFLEDGDRVVLRGWAGGDGRPRVGFGEVSGLVLPAFDGER